MINKYSFSLALVLVSLCWAPLSKAEYYENPYFQEFLYLKTGEFSSAHTQDPSISLLNKANRHIHELNYQRARIVLAELLNNTDISKVARFLGLLFLEQIDKQSKTSLNQQYLPVELNHLDWRHEETSKRKALEDIIKSVQCTNKDCSKDCNFSEEECQNRNLPLKLPIKKALNSWELIDAKNKNNRKEPIKEEDLLILRISQFERLFSSCREAASLRAKQQREEIDKFEITNIRSIIDLPDLPLDIQNLHAGMDKKNFQDCIGRSDHFLNLIGPKDQNNQNDNSIEKIKSVYALLTYQLAAQLGNYDARSSFQLYQRNEWILNNFQQPCMMARMSLRFGDAILGISPENILNIGFPDPDPRVYRGWMKQNGFEFGFAKDSVSDASRFYAHSRAICPSIRSELEVRDLIIDFMTQRHGNNLTPIITKAKSLSKSYDDESGRSAYWKTLSALLERDYSVTKDSFAIMVDLQMDQEIHALVILAQTIGFIQHQRTGSFVVEAEILEVIAFALRSTPYKKYATKALKLASNLYFENGMVEPGTNRIQASLTNSLYNLVKMETSDIELIEAIRNLSDLTSSWVTTKVNRNALFEKTFNRSILEPLEQSTLVLDLRSTLQSKRIADALILKIKQSLKELEPFRTDKQCLVNVEGYTKNIFKHLNATKGLKELLGWKNLSICNNKKLSLTQKLQLRAIDPASLLERSLLKDQVFVSSDPSVNCRMTEEEIVAAGIGAEEDRFSANFEQFFELGEDDLHPLDTLTLNELHKLELSELTNITSLDLTGGEYLINLSSTRQISLGQFRDMSMESIRAEIILSGLMNDEFSSFDLGDDDSIITYQNDYISPSTKPCGPDGAALLCDLSGSGMEVLSKYIEEEHKEEYLNSILANQNLPKKDLVVLTELLVSKKAEEPESKEYAGGIYIPIGVYDSGFIPDSERLQQMLFLLKADDTQFMQMSLAELKMMMNSQLLRTGLSSSALRSCVKGQVAEAAEYRALDYIGLGEFDQQKAKIKALREQMAGWLKLALSVHDFELASGWLRQFEEILLNFTDKKTTDLKYPTTFELARFEVMISRGQAWKAAVGLEDIVQQLLRQYSFKNDLKSLKPLSDVIELRIKALIAAEVTEESLYEVYRYHQVSQRIIDILLGLGTGSSDALELASLEREMIQNESVIFDKVSTERRQALIKQVNYEASLVTEPLFSDFGQFYTKLKALPQDYTFQVFWLNDHHEHPTAWIVDGEDKSIEMSHFDIEVEKLSDKVMRLEKRLAKKLFDRHSKKMAKELYSELGSGFRNIAKSKKLALMQVGNVSPIRFSALIDDNGAALYEKFPITYLDDWFGNKATIKKPGKLIYTTEKSAAKVSAAITDAAALFQEGFEVHELDQKRSGESLLSSPHWLHLATHGVVDLQNPFESFVKLNNNENLEAWWLSRFSGNAELIFLSACETNASRKLGRGLNQLKQFSYGISELLHHSGTRWVISSPWKPRESTAARLVGSFYDYLSKGQGFSEALMNAKISLGDQQSAVVVAPFIISSESINNLGLDAM